MPTNLELMGRLTGEVTQTLLDSVPANVELGHFILVPSENSELYTFADNVIARVLTAAGYRVYEGSSGRADTTGTMLRLEYQTLKFDLKYPKIYRPFLIGGKKVQRDADVRLLFKLVDPTDQSVVWIGEAERSHKDKFSYGDLEEIEAGSFMFTKPEQKSTSWGKVVEPVVVSGIIIGLIYLFFSNQ